MAPPAARNDNAAVRLQGNVARLGEHAAEVGRDLAVAVEGSIEAAVGVVPSEGEEAPERAVGVADRHDPAVGLDRQRSCLGVTPEAGRHDAVGIEGRVEAAVRVVAGERERAAVASRRGGARRHDLAVGL